MTEPIYDSSYGIGMEGFLNYANILVDNFLIPIFLIVVFVALLSVLSRGQWTWGVNIAFTSFVCALLASIALTFTEFSGFFIFIFIIGIGVGIIVSAIENS